MRVETFIPSNSWDAAATTARAAEQAGLDAIFTAEIANDPFIPLAFAARATERIHLGTCIAVAFPRSPMVTANLARDLHFESGGRFSLGLGSQVKGHNERRFSVPWSPPVPRLREYVEALRAIWRCWETGEKLEFEGEHYRFSLMTPEFSPGPTGLGPIPVSVAAVRPAMIRMAGQVCDGVKLHGFATRKYLDDVALPALREGMARSGRERSRFEIAGGGFIATGADADEVAKAVEMIRYRIAFYGSTRTYHVVFACHGWEELGLKLHDLVRRGEWEKMAAAIPDEVVHEFTAIATHRDLKGAVEKRFGGLVDSIGIGLPDGGAAGAIREVVEDLQSIPCGFVAH